MGNMSIMGSYSGIGMDTVDQLMEAEKAKGVRFTNKKLTIEKQQNAWKDVSTRLDNFYKQIENLQKRETFYSQTVKSNVKDSPFLSVSANNKAISGTYEMKIEQLATASRLTGGTILNLPELTPEDIKNGVTISDKDLNISGTFTINSKGSAVPTDIKVDKGDSLKVIAEKINGQTKESGVKASIVDNRLVLTDTKMGAREISVEGTGTLAADLGFSIENGNLSTDKISIGKQSIIKVDGLTITRDSNQITDAIEGLTIDLTAKPLTGESEMITISQDSQKTVDAVKNLVEQYNSLMSFIDDKTDYGDPSAENNKTGELAGESSILRLQSGLRGFFNSNVKGKVEGSLKNFSDLGVEMDRYGKLTLDETKLNEVISEDPANVARFFYEAEAVNLEGADPAAKAGNPKGGMSELLKNFVDSYTSSSKGIIKTRQDSYDRMLKDIEKQIETFDMRMDRKRTRYIREFTALDQAMMQAESQMDFMYSQLGMGQE